MTLLADTSEEISAALREMRRETHSMRGEMQTFSQLQRESMNLIRTLVAHVHEESCLAMGPAMHADNFSLEPAKFETSRSMPPLLSSDSPCKPEEDGMEAFSVVGSSGPTERQSSPPILPLADASKPPPSPKHSAKKMLDRQNSCASGISRQNSRGSALWRPSLARQSLMNDSGAPKAVFDFKEQVKRQITKTRRDVTTLYKKEGIWQHIARSHEFETLTLLIIGVNAIWIAVDTDNNNADAILHAHWVFQVVENLFSCFFTFELFVRFQAFKLKKNALKNGWFVFDSALVLFMVVETWVMSIILFLSTTSSSGDNSLLANAAILRMARLLRLSRMARLARLVRAVPELAILIKGMFASLRSVATTFWLLAIVLYIFAIVFAQMTQGSEAGLRWHSVPYSMYTLWLYGVLCLDYAEEITDEFLRMPSLITGIGLWALYFVFVLLATFTIMNMLIGVLCEVVSAVAASEKEALLLQYAREKLKGILEQLDLNADGAVSQGEFAKLVMHKDACTLLHDLGIDVVGLFDFADVIFDSSELEDEADEITIEFDHFVDLVLQLRGTSHSTVKDIVELRKLIRTVLHQQSSIHQILIKAYGDALDLSDSLCRTASIQ